MLDRPNRCDHKMIQMARTRTSWTAITVARDPRHFPKVSGVPESFIGVGSEAGRDCLLCCRLLQQSFEVRVR